MENLQYRQHPIRVKENKYFYFVTTSCHKKSQFFASPKVRDYLLEVLKEIQEKYRIFISGFVIMPEHIHLLIYDETRTVSDCMRVIKSITARSLRKGGFIQSPKVWLPRFYSFNVYSRAKLQEKLEYCHKNPLRRDLVESPDVWRHSSFHFYQNQDNSVFPVKPWWEIWGV